MFGFFDRNKPHPIDLPIKQVLDAMEFSDIENRQEYEDYVGYLERLHKLRREEKRWVFSPDTILVVVGNVAVALLIVAYEQKHVITSKAPQFTLKTNQHQL